MRQSLIIGDELSCEHIELAQEIIAAQFPSVHGLQNPLSLSTIDGSHNKCLQIHVIDDARWIASSCQEKVVTVYDSYNCGRNSAILEKQLDRSAVDIIIEDRFPQLPVYLGLPTIQQQNGYNDSGIILFAIAFSVHFALGNTDEIEHIIFERSHMRNHPLHHKKFEPFPHTSSMIPS